MALTPEEQEAVRGGLAAAALLDSEAFQLTTKALIYERFCDFTETKPGERDRREAIYNQMIGLQAIEGLLRARVQSKDAIEARLNADALDAEDDI